MSHVLYSVSLREEIGKITPFAMADVDSSIYLSCVGEEVSRTEYPELFAKIGESFGAGDGVNTFHLPDLRGRAMRGQDEGIGRDIDSVDRFESNPGGATGDSIGSAQNDMYKRHTHTYTRPYDRTSDDNANDKWQAYGHGGTYNSSQSGGNETRSKNVSIKYYIRFKI